MDNLHHSLAQTFGPLVQILFFFLILFLAVWCICAAAFWCEHRLVRTGNPIWRALPFPALALGLLYGGLRFSGRLLYSSDGWDQWGIWNYTNQNSGTYVLFICGCLLIGTALAVRSEKASPKD